MFLEKPYDYKANQRLKNETSNKPFDGSGKTEGNRRKKFGESWIAYCPRILRAKAEQEAAVKAVA